MKGVMTLICVQCPKSPMEKYPVGFLGWIIINITLLSSLVDLVVNAYYSEVRMLSTASSLLCGHAMPFLRFQHQDNHPI